MNMEIVLYLSILAYFMLGAVAFALIGKKKDKAGRKDLWTKYISYFLIINLLFGSIYIGYPWFLVVATIIAFAGLLEIITLRRLHGNSSHNVFFTLSVTIYIILMTAFILFSTLDKQVLYFVFFVVTVFDAFSQISGQLFGKKKLMPRISPGKTIGGLSGGALLALITATLFSSLLGIAVVKALFFAAIIVIFAFWGDFLASFYKRKFNVKDFGKRLPGHGGFLDRFDSLIPAGAAMYLLNYFMS